MKLVSFDGGFGRLENGSVIPMGDDLVTYLETGARRDGASVPADRVRLRAPVLRPRKILPLGPSYVNHAREAGQPLPKSADELVLMAKFANSIIGPGDDIEMPAATAQNDYEAELAIVIGRRAREVAPDEVPDHIAGYMCVNDVTERDLQFRLGSGWTRAKAIDTFLPCGPWLVTPEEVGDVHALNIRCYVNGELRQDTNTSELLFSVPEMVASVSKTVTLEPGDIIPTGTPPGVGYGRKPQVFLQEGDVVRVEIDKLGVLENRVVRRPGVRGQRPRVRT